MGFRYVDHLSRNIEKIGEKKKKSLFFDLQRSSTLFEFARERKGRVKGGVVRVNGRLIYTVQRNPIRRL